MLATDQLTIGYAARIVANHISLQLNPGEAVAVLGPNGSGKTTLFRTLLGLLPALQGEVRLNSRLLDALTPAEIARDVAYVPQVSAGFFNFSVIEVVEMARVPHLAWYAKPGAFDRKISEQALDELGMSAFVNRMFSSLSGGEQQLVLIARALAAEASTILLDEPTASLDFGNQFLILDAIAKLTGSGRSVLFTTHNPEHALRTAKRTLTMSRDGKVEIGATDIILNSESLASLYGIHIQLFDGPNGRMIAVSK